VINLQVNQILERLEKADKRDALDIVVGDIRESFGIDHIAYQWVSSAAASFGCSTFAQDWSERYAALNYERVDPVVVGCFQRFEPVEWKQLDWSSRAARAYLSDALAHGVGRQGYSIPIRGPNGQFALFSANHNCDDGHWATFTETHCRDLILIAHFFNQKALALGPDRVAEALPALSPRELDAITLLAAGYSRAKVADNLSISEHTLRVYIESARFKLGALNTTHAVARALSRGLIVV
jgi:DNA-binding CsgD family transcriptional regulator